MSMLNCQSSSAEDVVRKAVFAGSWYDSNPEKLRLSIQRYIADGTKLDVYPQMLVSPHAGHAYSGPVAGKGYATIDKSVERVFLLGPSHRVFLKGVSIPEVDYYENPLGRIPLDKKVISELRKNSLVNSNMQAHSQEHCLEIQLPFLQVTLSSFSIVPILMSEVDPKMVADLIRPYIDEKTLVVASSDFAHVNSYGQCKKLDERSIKSIMNEEIGGFIEACGEVPIRTMLVLSDYFNCKPILLDARNSRDIVPGPKNSYTVGYASVVFVKENGKSKNEENGDKGKDKHNNIMQLTNDEKAYLLSLARDALNAAVKGDALPSPKDPPPITKELCGCFVTLKKHGELRGCIGYIEGIKPLYEAIIDNAKNAALKDHRFPRVKEKELKDIDVEVSVLTKPEPLEYSDPDDLLNKIVAGEDGIILRKGWNQSTYLPQVWEQIPDKVQFLEYLSRKGGMSSDGWKSAEVKRYRAIHFEE